MPHKTPKAPPDLLDATALLDAPGVHLNMPEAQYFAREALGQSEFKILLRDPASWWYSSRHNPNRPERAPRKGGDAQGKEIGSALHTLLFEGVKAYEARHAIEPDEALERQVARTATEIRKLLETNGIEIDKSEYRKGVLLSIAKRHGLQHKIWDWHQKRFEAQKRDGKTPISASLDYRLRHMAALVEHHPDLGPGLKMGLSEVSVFWDHILDDGTTVRLRARFDKISPDWSLDLKTIGNWQGRSPKAAAIMEITQREYDIQRCFYDTARRKLQDFVVSGEVYAWATDGAPVRPLAAERRRLDEIAAAATWKWVWMFYQVQVDHPDPDKARAPVVEPFFHEPTGQVWDDAQEKIDRALENFARLRRQNGMDKPWAQVSEIRELTDADLASLRFKGLPR